MGSVFFFYSLRNLWTRKLTTVLTAGGMALVVFVFASVLMLAAGLQKTLVDTGSRDNVVVIRKGAQTEVQSSISREQASIMESQPEIATGTDGEKLVAKELVVLINLLKRGTNNLSNVEIRGIGRESLALRPQVRIVEGRMPKPGTSEIIAGQGIAGRFQGAGLGESLRFAMRNWRVVGIFDADNTGFNSEIWANASQLMQAFRRPAYSSVIFRLRDSSGFGGVKARLESDPRLAVDVLRETQYYKDQSELMAKFLRIMGLSLTVIFSVGAIIGAMITMYAAVSSRVSEIGTLRALGFRRRDITLAFILESLLLGGIGGAAGLFLASFLQLFTISTMNWQTFSELAFTFTLTFDIFWKSLAFALAMGLIGGVPPAVRAARMNIVDALRTS